MNAKIITEYIGVMKKNHSAVRHFWEPSFKIMAHRFVGVQAVDVQQIHAAIGKLRQSLVKGHAQQRRERGITRIVLPLQRLVDSFAVGAGMRVA